MVRMKRAGPCNKTVSFYSIEAWIYWDHGSEENTAALLSGCKQLIRALKRWWEEMLTGREKDDGRKSGGDKQEMRMADI